MNMPEEIISAVKDNNSSLVSHTPTEQDTPTAVIKSSTMLDKITHSYNTLNTDIRDYNHAIRTLRKNADQLKKEINLNKSHQNKNQEIKTHHEASEEQDIQAHLKTNNSVLTEETCDTTMGYIKTIKSTISHNSRAAKEALIPLEKSFNLLKMQVKYTVLLEDILDLFKKKSAAKSKLNDSNQIISMLAESLGIDEESMT